LTEKTLYSRAVQPSSGNVLNFVSLVFHLLPKNLISYAVGSLVRMRLPQPVSTWVNRAFASAFRLDMSEAEHGLGHYATIEDVFTRTLKPGARPVAPPVCSPADGILARSLPADDGTAVQAKGLTYSLAELVFGDTPRPADPPELAWYQTVYLAPHNYHRVHAPFSGTVDALRYLPGDLWPVNVPFVMRIPRLFCRNERLVFDFALVTGGRAYVVMVGALNVGRMVTPLLPDLVTNATARQSGASASTHRFPTPRPVSIGDELGTFMLGSTVIIAYDKAALAGFTLAQATESRPILMGQSLTAP
jgi:phosphatidylserine decarboxylase